MDFSEHLNSDTFAQRERHPDFPQAFTRTRKLSPPALVGGLMCLRGGTAQSALDHFYDSLCGAVDEALGVLRHASDQALAKARSRLHQPVLAWLNDCLMACANRRLLALYLPQAELSLHASVDCDAVP